MGARVGALIGGGLALAYVDRHLVPASQTGWTASNISRQVVNAAIPVAGFVLASRRPQNRIGWLFLVAGADAGPERLLEPVRPGRAGRRPEVLASGPGVRLAIELDLGYPDRHARFFVPALPDGVRALPALAGLLISVAAIVVRFAKSSGEERLQLKWCATAALVLVVVFIASIWVHSAVVNVLESLALQAPLQLIVYARI